MATMESEDQLGVYIQLAKAAAREVVLNKDKATLLWGFVTLGVLVAGLYAPKTYESASTLYVNQQSIITPLLAGQASMTKVQNHSRVVRETIQSPTIMREVATQVGLLKGDESDAKVERVINDLRADMEIKAIGPSYISLKYNSASPEQAFHVVTSATDSFISHVNENKKRESRSAYEFIEKQVKSYKAQLVNAENALKEFKEQNTDGSESTVRSRMQSYEDQIESIQLDIDERQVKIISLEKELKGEKRVLVRQQKTDVYRNRMAQLARQKEALLLTVTESHPDVVDLDFQISALRESIKSVTSGSEESADHDKELNPVFGSLRQSLSAEKVELSSSQRRLAVTKERLKNEQEKLSRVVAYGAEFSELNRDYGVTKKIYEDMLARKEKARLSMVLDIEEQGVNYSIQEPALFPQTPKGVRFLYFVLGAPFVGLLVVGALMFAYVVVDPRIRIVEKLEEAFDIPIIATVPHVYTPLSTRIFRKDIILIIVFTFMISLAYAAVITLRYLGYV
jgi:polysaccharide chain length determinant protein (PEP-CTERM system associated)